MLILCLDTLETCYTGVNREIYFFMVADFKVNVADDVWKDTVIVDNVYSWIIGSFIHILLLKSSTFST